MKNCIFSIFLLVDPSLEYRYTQTMPLCFKIILRPSSIHPVIVWRSYLYFAQGVGVFIGKAAYDFRKILLSETDREKNTTHGTVEIENTRWSQT